jgi:RNA polymerase sigma-70 factor (ECF subfamily)
LQESWLEIVRGLRGLAMPARLRPGRSESFRGAAPGRSALPPSGGGWRRSQGRRPEPVAEAAAGAADGDRLRAAIRGLPPEQRAAIALFHFEELSVAEVAVALDVPAGTVKTRLMHARRKLRAVLEGDA